MHPMLNTAIKAARKAGNIINRASLNIDLLTIDKKQHNDFVTEIDHAAEQAIIEILTSAYPSHGILSEEAGQSWPVDTPEPEYVWIIDPLDGTTNFIHGFPQYAVSIALAQKGQVQQAVIYDPSRDELFNASRGGGAYLNSKRLRVAKRERLADALLGTGFPFRSEEDVAAYLKIFSTMSQQCVGLRRAGAAALDLAYVAAGRFDGFFEQGLKPWDMAAGMLLITEAGGLIGNYAGNSIDLYNGEILTANPRLFSQMVQHLAPHTLA